MQFDVVIVGGGPAGSTLGSLICKYNAALSVAIFERSRFPRDHVGESQLPGISKVLDEMGVWDKVEAAGFPVKIGVTYRWGNSPDLWDFHFLPNGEFHDEPRPARYAGQRLRTAFQVDRSKFDKILLDHAGDCGCRVEEGIAVRSCEVLDNKVAGLTLDDGRFVTARYYVDASGHSGILRRSLGIGTEQPSNLQNVAFWNYWTNAEWAVTLGQGGTRIQVMSLGYGWLWYIPISPTRASVGLVCPAAFYKRTGQSPETLYLHAVRSDPRISGFLRKATMEENFSTTKDWSFVADKMAGENWLLIGEACGFADPILSAGMTLAHSSAREAAYTILEIERGGDRQWLLNQYESRSGRGIRQHIRFADYWYTANGHFTELREFTREIAKDAGLELDAYNAFQWLGTGGFVDENVGVGALAQYDFASIHQIVSRLSKQRPRTAFGGFNGFVLNLDGAKKEAGAVYEAGRVSQLSTYVRDGKRLPVTKLVAWVIRGFEHSPRFADAFGFIQEAFQASGAPFTREVQDKLLEILEAMVRDGWLIGRRYKNLELLPEDVPSQTQTYQPNRDAELPAERRAESLR